MTFGVSPSLPFLIIVSTGCPFGWEIVMVWVPSLFSFTVTVGVGGIKSTTSIVMSFVRDLPPALVTVTGISNAPATVGVPEIVLADSSYVTPAGNFVVSTVSETPSGTVKVIGRRLVFPKAIIWRSFLISNDTGSSTTFRIIVASALSFEVPLPNNSESSVAFKRIIYVPGLVGVPLIVCVAEL